MKTNFPNQHWSASEKRPTETATRMKQDVDKNATVRRVRDAKCLKYWESIACSKLPGQEKHQRQAPRQSTVPACNIRGSIGRRGHWFRRNTQTSTTYQSPRSGYQQDLEHINGQQNRPSISGHGEKNQQPYQHLPFHLKGTNLIEPVPWCHIRKFWMHRAQPKGRKA